MADITTKGLKFEGLNATFAGNIALASGKYITSTVASGGGTWFAIDHTGNENWTFDAKSGSGVDDYISVGISGGTRAMSWHEDGKVGMGTTAPASLLHVAGTVQVGVNDAGHDVYFYGDTTNRYLKWDASEDALFLPDNTQFRLGTSSDLRIYHNGTDSYLTNATGALKIATETSGIAVSIGHTTSETTVNDNLTVTGTTTFAGDVTIDHSTNVDSTLKLHAYSSALGDAYAWNLTAENSANSYAFRILQGTTPVITIDNTASGGGNNITFAGKIIGQDPASVQLELKRTSSGTDGNTSIKFVQPLGDSYLGVNLNGDLSFGTDANLVTNNKFKVDRSGNATFAGDIDVTGTVDGIDIATKAAVWDTYETNSTNVLAAGALMANQIIDEDNMASDSVARVASQQSIKAYADTKLPLTGGTMSGAIAMGSQNITGGGTITGTTLTGTSLDINGNADISGNLTGVDNITADVHYVGNASNYLDVATGLRLRSDSNGIRLMPNGTDAGYIKHTGIDLVQPLTIGANGTGHDVKFFGTTSGKYMLWDETEDNLIFTDNTNIVFGDGSDASIGVASDNLVIKNDTTDKDIVLQSDDGTGSLATYLTIDGSTGWTTLHTPVELVEAVEPDNPPAGRAVIWMNPDGNIYAKMTVEETTCLVTIAEFTGGE